MNFGFPAFYVWGATTDVGKTFLCRELIKASTSSKINSLYLKPFQTGFPDTSDLDAVSLESNFFHGKTFVAYSEAVSPHLMPFAPSDEDVTLWLKIQLQSLSGEKRIAFIEGAGGVLSPASSGNWQADVFREIRLPVLLVADSRVGGIGTAVAAWEALKMRGYEVIALCLFDADVENEKILNKLSPCISLSKPDVGTTTLNFINEFFEKKNEKLIRLKKIASENFWWPFTQHAFNIQPQIIDSSYGEEWQVVGKERPIYDASAGWWTRGYPFQSHDAVLEVAGAIGRYGHVIFPGNVHEPAADLTELLLNSVGKNWAARVFFSDNGSSAVEIALKMALRKSSRLYEGKKNFYILGMEGSYHGDTLGAMIAASPNYFNENEPWYHPQGCWLTPPEIIRHHGRYFIHSQKGVEEFEFVEEIFFDGRKISNTYVEYKEQIVQFILDSERNGVTFGALILEPIMHGSGGMKFIDPMFQVAMVEVAREKNIPVIIDEIFSGFWRLGEVSASETLKIKPDIACFGKLLTGGLLPLAVTLATKEIYNEFLGEEKKDALLHGHSYTAYPAGCAAAAFAVRKYLDELGGKSIALWDEEMVKALGFNEKVASAVALGTILAIKMKSPSESYGFQVGEALLQKLMSNGIAVRPLGGVLYFMCSPLAKKSYTTRILKLINESI